MSFEAGSHVENCFVKVNSAVLSGQLATAPAEIDWRFALTVGIPAAIVVVGWFLGHMLNARRDLASRKREARIKTLETAYLRIAKVSNRLLTDELMDELELFVFELQLHGTPTQLASMQEIVEGLKKPNNPVSFDAILVDMRDTIRRELDLETVTGGVWWFRFNRTPKENQISGPGGSSMVKPE